MVGIYADEAITGTKVDKREQFQRMIQDCMDVVPNAKAWFESEKSTTKTA